MKPSSRQSKLLSLAANVAQQSDHKTHRIGAVLVKGGSVINTSCNKVQWNSFASRFAHLRNNCQPEHASVHAEIGTVLGISRNKTRGADIYVVRVRKINEKYGLAKPCKMCQGLLTEVGIKRIFYTINENEIGKMVIK